MDNYLCNCDEFFRQFVVVLLCKLVKLRRQVLAVTTPYDSTNNTRTDCQFSAKCKTYNSEHKARFPLPELTARVNGPS